MSDHAPVILDIAGKRRIILGQLAQQTGDALQIVLDAVVHFPHQQIAMCGLIDQALLLHLTDAGDIPETADVMGRLPDFIADGGHGDANQEFVTIWALRPHVALPCTGACRL